MTKMFCPPPGFCLWRLLESGWWHGLAGRGMRCAEGTSPQGGKGSGPGCLYRGTAKDSLQARRARARRHILRYLFSGNCPEGLAKLL